MTTYGSDYLCNEGQRWWGKEWEAAKKVWSGIEDNRCSSLVIIILITMVTDSGFPGFKWYSNPTHSQKIAFCCRLIYRKSKFQSLVESSLSKTYFECFHNVCAAIIEACCAAIKCDISLSAVDSQFRYFCKFLHICLGFSLESIFSRISCHLLDIFPFLFDCYFGGGQHREIWTINLRVSGDVPVVNAKNWVIGTHDANDNDVDRDCAHRDDDVDHDGVNQF